MKVWSVIFNFIGVSAILIILQCFYIQMDAWDKDFETARLEYQSDYAAEAAFIKSMSGGDLGIDYIDLTKAELSPEKSLYGFQLVMCLGYDKPFNDENIERVNDLIETSVLACSNGYYITPIKKNNFDNREVCYDWSAKIPYLIETDDMSSSLIGAITSKSVMKKNEIKSGLFTLRGNDVYLLGKDARPFEGVGSVQISSKDRQLILSNINRQINGAIIDNIVSVQSANNTLTHKVYLPSSQTISGINTINNPSFLMVLSGKGFTTNGFINQTVMSGYKTIRKMYVVGYTYRNKDKNGNLTGDLNYKYCYETQLPKGYESGTSTRGPIKIKKFFTSIERAANDGYVPDLEYLQRRINYEK